MLITNILATLQVTSIKERIIYNLLKYNIELKITFIKHYKTYNHFVLKKQKIIFVLFYATNNYTVYKCIYLPFSNIISGLIYFF